MMDFNVDREFILQAHKEACGSWKKKIEEKFPELFKTVNASAIPIGAYESGDSGLLRAFSQEAFGDKDALQILDSAYPYDRPELRFRALYVRGIYDAEVIDACQPGKIILIKRR